jgi:hypothetical protein
VFVINWGALILSCLVAWLLPTVQMSQHMQYFMKSGLYNNEPLFSPPQSSLLLLVAPVAVACLASAIGTKQPLRKWGAALLGSLILSVCATTLGLYLWIYFDLSIARLWGQPSVGLLFSLALVFELGILAIMYIVSSTFIVPNGQNSLPFHRAFVSFSSIGLAKTILLLAAPSVPLWGLAELTCDGPCL